MKQRTQYRCVSEQDGIVDECSCIWHEASIEATRPGTCAAHLDSEGTHKSLMRGFLIFKIDAFEP